MAAEISLIDVRPNRKPDDSPEKLKRAGKKLEEAMGESATNYVNSYSAKPAKSVVNNPKQDKSTTAVPANDSRTDNSPLPKVKIDNPAVANFFRNNDIYEEV